MVMSDIIQEQYNKATELTTISYNIITHLIKNNENIFKLLKYSSPSALQEQNLSSAEKGAMIYSGYGDMNNYRIFLDSGQDDSIIGEICVLRISPIEISPINHIFSSVSVGFECYVHSKINALNNYTTRLDNVMHELLLTLNGADIENFGRLYFDRRASSRCKIGIIGALPYKGKALIMCNYLLG
jgi:hypothetical protein